jgi:hypothetical protein
MRHENGVIATKSVKFCLVNARCARKWRPAHPENVIYKCTSTKDKLDGNVDHSTQHVGF